MEKFPTFLKIQLNDSDIIVLVEYAKKIEKPNCYLEIGTCMGGSSLIAKSSVNFGVEIYTIDNKPVYAFKESGIDVNFIIGDSIEQSKNWNKPIGLLFIDGDHNKSYEDFLAWEKYVVKGGYILFHDYINAVSVKKDCQTILENNKFEKIFVPNFNGEGTRILQIKKL